MTREQYIENWIDRYMDEHPDEKIEDFEALRVQADCEWFDNEVDHGGAKTEYDLTEEQEKVAKSAMKGMARAVDAYGKERKRERKPNPDKREVIQALDEALTDVADDVVVVNPEKQIDFVLNGVHYSVTLTAHRPPKTK